MMQTTFWRTLPLLALVLALGGAASANLLGSGDFSSADWTPLDPVPPTGVTYSQPVANWTQYATVGSVDIMPGRSFAGQNLLPSYHTPDGTTVTCVGVPPNSYYDTTPAGNDWMRVKCYGVLYEEGGLYQKFGTVPGGFYTVSVWMITRYTSMPSGTMEATLGVDPTGAVLPGTDTVWSTPVMSSATAQYDPFDWEQRSLTVQATGNSMTVFLNSKLNSTKTAQGNSFFDVVVADGPPIPEPGGMIALLSGFAALAGFGLRRK